MQKKWTGSARNKIKLMSVNRLDTRRYERRSEFVRVSNIRSLADCPIENWAFQSIVLGLMFVIYRLNKQIASSTTKKYNNINIVEIV